MNKIPGGHYSEQNHLITNISVKKYVANYKKKLHMACFKFKTYQFLTKFS